MKKPIYALLMLMISSNFGMEHNALVKYRALLEELAGAESIDYPRSEWLGRLTDTSTPFHEEKLRESATGMIYTLFKGRTKITVSSKKLDAPVEFSIAEFKREINKIR